MVRRDNIRAGSYAEVSEIVTLKDSVESLEDEIGDEDSPGTILYKIAHVRTITTMTATTVEGVSDILKELSVGDEFMMYLFTIPEAGISLSDVKATLIGIASGAYYFVASGKNSSADNLREIAVNADDSITVYTVEGSSGTTAASSAAASLSFASTITYN